MSAKTVDEQCEFEVDKGVDPASQQLIRGLAAATLKKAEKDWNEIIRWYTQELQAGRPPIDLRTRAAGNYYAAAQKFRELSAMPRIVNR
jgi:hypothetical protein